MEQGPTEEVILKQCVRQHRPAPDKIVNAPRVREGLDIFWRAFFDLTTCRTLGWVEGPIPWTAIDRYAAANDYEGSQREDLFHHVRRMDEAFLNWQKSKKESK